MRHVDLLRADMGAGLRGVATVDSLLAVQQIQPLILFLFPRIHHPDDAGHRRIGADKGPVPADAGLGAAEAVDATRRLFIPGKLLGRNPVLRHPGGKFFRFDEVGFRPVDTLVGPLPVHDEIPDDRGDRYRRDLEFRRAEQGDGVLHKQLAGKHRPSVDIHRATAALGVLAGRRPGQRGVLLHVDSPEQIDEPQDRAGVEPVGLKPAHRSIRIVTLDRERQGIDFGHPFLL